MGSSVIISTYAAPRELDLALCGLSRQSTFPDEVLVADDGSGVETNGIVEKWSHNLPFPLKHCWQEDRGYRKSRIVNEAVRQSNGDHLIFLDGDSFPHKDWVADHLVAADSQRVLCGRRVKLGSNISARINCEQVLSGFFDKPWGLIGSAISGRTKRLPLGVRLPAWLARLFHPRPRRLMGVNFSLPRETFLSVNGHNEDWTFYGREDLDLEIRLKRFGSPFFPLLNRGVVFHLHHAERVRSEEVEALIRETEESGSIRCLNGVECEIPFDPAG